MSNAVPRAVDSATAIRTAAAAHAALLPTPADSSAIEVVLGLLAGREQPTQRPTGSAGAEPASALEEPAYGQEQEQEQEQEEEQEQEQEQEQQKEQEQEQEEPDEFTREKYSRNDEGLRPWELAALSSPPSDKASGFYAEP